MYLYLLNYRSLKMERILANKTVSLTELRDPAKVLAAAGGSPVAVLNRSNVVGYFVPKSAVDNVTFRHADTVDVNETVDESIEQNKKLLDYLKDK